MVRTTRSRVWVVSLFVDIRSESLMGLALFHTLFNMLGVVIFFPFLGPFSRLLTKIYPDYKTILTVYLNQTPPEITDAATAALRKEIGHLLQECQLYNLRLLRIDEKLVFDTDLPFETSRKKKYTIDELYENIKLLHAAIEKSSRQPRVVMLGHISSERNDAGLAKETVAKYFAQKKMPMDFDLVTAPLYGASEVVTIAD